MGCIRMDYTRRLLLKRTMKIITGSLLLNIPAVAGMTASIVRSEIRICRNLMVMIILRFTWFVSANLQKYSQMTK